MQNALRERGAFIFLLGKGKEWSDLNPDTSQFIPTELGVKLFFNLMASGVENYFR
jgi:hypothetical protein